MGAEDLVAEHTRRRNAMGLGGDGCAPKCSTAWILLGGGSANRPGCRAYPLVCPSYPVAARKSGSGAFGRARLYHVSSLIKRSAPLERSTPSRASAGVLMLCLRADLSGASGLGQNHEDQRCSAHRWWSGGRCVDP